MFFFLLPVGVDYRTERLPMVTFSLMGACTLVHLWSMVLWFANPDGYEWWFHTFWLTPASLKGYQLITTLFVHADIFHLLGNMVYLFLFGACVEDILGRGRFLLLYVLGGILASFAYIFLSPGHFASPIPLGGASGAISTCMGAFLVLMAKSRIEFKYFGLVFLRPFGGEFYLPAWVVMSFWFLKDLFWTVIGMLDNKPTGGTAFGAHTGGFLFGLAAIGASRALFKTGSTSSETTDDEIPERKPEPMRVTAGKTARPTLAANNIMVAQNNQEYGPYTIEEARKYRAEGAISLDAFYWCEGMPEWRPISEL